MSRLRTTRDWFEKAKETMDELAHDESWTRTRYIASLALLTYLFFGGNEPEVFGRTRDSTVRFFIQFARQRGILDQLPGKNYRWVQLERERLYRLGLQRRWLRQQELREAYGRQLRRDYR